MDVLNLTKITIAWEMYESGIPKAHIASQLGINRETIHIWIKEIIEVGLLEFLDQKVNAPGSVVVAILTGVRPLLVEIQALVTKSNLPVPRRTGSGVDNNRLQLLVAVLQKKTWPTVMGSGYFCECNRGASYI